MKKQYVRHHQKGFTIVELLIVIVVIAILATISIVAYNGIQQRAQRAIVKNDMRNFQQQLEAFNVDNGRYPLNATELATVNNGGKPVFSKEAYQLGRNNIYYIVVPGGANYGVAAVFKDPAGPGEHYGSNPQTGDGIVITSLNGVNEMTAIDSGVIRNILDPSGTVTFSGSNGYHGAGANPTYWQSWVAD